MNSQLTLSLVLAILLAGNAQCSGNGVATGPKVTDIVFFDLTIGGEPLGRVEIGLFGKTGMYLKRRNDARVSPNRIQKLTLIISRCPSASHRGEFQAVGNQALERVFDGRQSGRLQGLDLSPCHQRIHDPGWRL